MPWTEYRNNDVVLEKVKRKRKITRNIKKSELKFLGDVKKEIGLGNTGTNRRDSSQVGQRKNEYSA